MGIKVVSLFIYVDRQLLLFGKIFTKKPMISVSHSVVSDSFVTPWTVACQTPRPWNFPGNNTTISFSRGQGIFPTQGSNLGLLNCRQIIYCLSYQGTNYYLWCLGRFSFFSYTFLSCSFFKIINICYFYNLKH